MKKLGLAYEDCAARTRRWSTVGVGVREHDRVAVRHWAAYAPIVEAMSGVYDYKQRADRPPVIAPVGALGDISSSLFGVIGILAALRHRDRTGEGQYVDISMLDSWSR
jgi:formyl-CoA transferase